MNALFWIIGANVLLFLLSLINQDVIFEYLGLIPFIFLERPWTIISNMFVHASIGHIFFNMLTLFFFGRALSMLLGVNRFLLVYFVGGIAGNILYLLLAPPLSVAVGASGAIFAVTGALVMLMPNLTVRLYFFIPVRLWIVVLVFFGIASLPGVMPGIAWQAHLGGLVFGLAAGYYFKRKMRVRFVM